MKIISNKYRYIWIKYFVVSCCVLAPHFIVAQSVEIKDNNSNTLIQINDEGNSGGSITVPDAGSISTGTENKLYNIGGNLMWSGAEIGATAPTGNQTYSLDAVDGSPEDVLYVNEEGNVGVGTLTPAGKMDINSTSGALIVPRMTTSQRENLPVVNGSIIYNSETKEFNFLENGSWSSL